MRKTLEKNPKPYLGGKNIFIERLWRSLRYENISIYIYIQTIKPGMIMRLLVAPLQLGETHQSLDYQNTG